MIVRPLRFMPLAVAATLGCTSMLPPGQARLENASRIPPALCDDATPAERATRVLGTRGLFGVELSRETFLSSKSYTRSRPAGVELRYAAPPAVTTAWFQRELECHQADVVLGRVAARDDDPYAAPDVWLAVDVTTAGSAMVVEVRAEDREAAAAILERARRLQRSQVR